MGVTIEHQFKFIAQQGGSTLMSSVIELSGPATFFVNGEMRKQGLEMFARWFDSMKAEAEKFATQASALA